MVYVWYKQHRSQSISDASGPKNSSWIYGISGFSMWDRILSRSCSETGYPWRWGSEVAGVVAKSALDECRTVARWNGSFWGRLPFCGWVESGPSADAILQQERLFIVDPKAIHHILQGTTYMDEKPRRIARELLEPAVNSGLASVEGELPLISHVIRQLNSNLGDIHKRQGGP